jgi:hypothetical protein
MVGKVACPTVMDRPHKLIKVLLDQDELLRQEQAKHRWASSKPKFDLPIERRRLRIWNALFVAATRIGCQVEIQTSQYAEPDRKTVITVGSTRMPFAVKSIGSQPAESSKQAARERLRLSLYAGHSEGSARKIWEDMGRASLEEQLADILVELIVTAEVFHREASLKHHDWLVRRRGELEAEERQRKIDEERRACELRAKEERERVERLLAQSEALRKAEAIRAYVEIVIVRSGELGARRADLDRWAMWALNEADRIDPVKNGIIVQAIVDLGGEMAAESGVL